MVTSWWAWYTKWPAKIDGNTLEKAWRPRPGYVWMAVACSLSSFSAAIGLTYCTHVDPTIRLFLLLLLLFNLGFAYTNHVTTARAGYWVGKHGDMRDVKAINLALPVVMYAGLGAAGWGWHVPSLLFEPNSAYIQSAAAADVSLAQDTMPWALLPQGAEEEVKAMADTVHAHLVYTFFFVLSFWVCLHVPYITRPGSFLARSVSQRDLATAGGHGYVGYAVKAAAALASVLEHARWAAAEGEFLPRLAAYTGLTLLVVCICRSVRDSHYWHLHHWAVGLLLTVLAHGTSPGWTLMVQGFALSQFVEGAARWSCAPLWHKLDV